MKSYIVTTSWDDGHKLDIKLARLLQKYDVKGTFYISQFYFSNTLTEAEIQELDAYHEIGAHTLTHVDLTSIALDQAKEEIEGSKLYLEKVLSHEINMFSYPKGHYNREIMEIVEKSGFLGARTCNHGSLEPPKNPYEWQISLHASNGSPLTTLRIWMKSKISIKAIFDWELRAKLLFDLFLKTGGIYHIWGHSWEIDKQDNWSKLQRVLQYISSRHGVEYATNGEILSRHIRK